VLFPLWVNNSEKDMEKDIIPKLGHPDLDDEHKNLLGFAMFCVLTCPHLESSYECYGCTTGKPEECQDGLRNILDHLLPYIQKHFEHEENAMRQVKLDEKDPMHMAIHLSAHNHLFQHFKTIAAELNTDEAGNDMVKKLRKLHDLIMDKLLDHLHMVDTKLIPYLAK